METDKTLKSKEIFNYIFEKAQQEGISLTPMQAIKLVYFAHAWYLGFKSEPLINESVQAWQFGAVIPSLYQALKIYGAGTVKSPILKEQQRYALSLLLGNKTFPSDQIIEPHLTPDQTSIIDAVWDSYKGFDGITLSNIIHQDGTPWSTVWDNGRCGRGANIPNELIKEYYQNKIASAQKKDGAAESTTAND